MVVQVRRDDWQTEREFDAFRQLTLEVARLREQIPSARRVWTAVVVGSGTPGTYEIATQNCQVAKVGRRVFLDVVILLAAALTGGGTGDLTITGIPFPISGSTCQGSVKLEGVDWTAGGLLTVEFRTASVLHITHTIDNAANAVLPISAVAVNDLIVCSISYETNA